MARAHSLAQEESKVSESTSVLNSELEKITAHAKSFTQEENKSGEQTLTVNTKMDKIIARAQSITRKGTKFGFQHRNEHDYIGRAHSFTREENNSSEPKSNEEDWYASLLSKTEDCARNQSYNKAIITRRTPDSQYVAWTNESQQSRGWGLG